MSYTPVKLFDFHDVMRCSDLKCAMEVYLDVILRQRTKSLFLLIILIMEMVRRQHTTLEKANSE